MVEVRAAAITSSSQMLVMLINRIEVNNTPLRAMDLRWPRVELDQKERRMTTKAVISIRYQIRSGISPILGRS
jgi:hypothetical protein